MEILDELKEGKFEEFKAWLAKQKEIFCLNQPMGENMELEGDNAIDISPCLILPGGVSLLHWAVSIGSLESTQLILKEAPELLNHKDMEGATPLHWASGEGRENTVTFLLSNKAQIIQDISGETPLHWACLNGHHSIAELLLNHKVDPNLQGSSGFTALHYSAINKFIKCVSVLLKGGANPKIKDNSGKTPIDVANSTKEKTIIDFFDPEKRVHVEQILTLQERQDVLDANLKNASSSKEKLERKLMAVYKELKDLEDVYSNCLAELNENKKTVKKLELDKDELTDKVTQMEKELQSVLQRNKELEERVGEGNQMLEDEKSKGSGRTVVRETMLYQIQEAHKSLSNLSQLLASTDLAVFDSKSQLNSLMETLSIL